MYLIHVQEQLSGNKRLIRTLHNLTIEHPVADPARSRTVFLSSLAKCCLYKFVPKLLHQILVDGDGKEKENIYKKYRADTELLDEYFDFTISNEFGFWIPKQLGKNFPLLDLSWKEASELQSAVIEFKQERSFDDLKQLIQILPKLGCRHIEIHFYRIVEWESLTEIGRMITEQSYQSVGFILFQSNYDEHDFIKAKMLSNEVPQLYKLSAYDAKIKANTKSDTDLKRNVNFYDFMYLRPENGRRFFKVSMDVFTEAQKHNVYYNRKIYFTSAISKRPYIETDYQAVDGIRKKLREPDYLSITHLSKDNIFVCNVCEFRYMCIDSRLPQLRMDGTGYFETECDYNPYLSKWSYETGYLTLKASRVSVGAEGVEIDGDMLGRSYENAWKF